MTQLRELARRYLRPENVLAGVFLPPAAIPCVQQNIKNSVQASEQFFRSIFENAQIGISFFNIDGSTVFSNRALHEMLGYTGEELSHFEQWDEIIHPDERAFGAERHAELVQGKHDNDEWNNASFAETAA